MSGSRAGLDGSNGVAPAGLSGRLGSGALRLAASSLAGRALSLLSLAVLARTLDAQAFGIAAYAAFAAGLLTLCVDRHLEMALIRRGFVERRDLDTVFTLRLIACLVLALAVLCASGPLSRLLGAPELRPVLRALALVPLVSGLFNPRFVLLERALGFRSVARAEAATHAAGAGAAIAVALATGSHWAAVAGILAACTTRTGLSWAMGGGAVGFGLSGAGGTLRFGACVAGASAATFLTDQANRVVAGALLGLGPLGQLRLGAELARTPVLLVQRPLLRGVYPGLVEARARGRATQEAFVALQSALLIAALPVAVLGAVAAPWAVRLAGGPGWQEAVPVLRALCLLTAVQALAAGAHALALAEGRPRLSLARQSAVLVLTVPLAWAGGAGWGLHGILLATALSQGAAAGLALGMAARLGVRLRGLWRALRGAALATLALAGAAGAVAQALPAARECGAAGALAALLCIGAAGLTVYAGALWACWRALGRPEGAEAAMARQLTAAFGARAAC